MKEDSRLEENLIYETHKWLGRAEDRVAVVKGDESFLQNVEAYISDARHFLDMDDPIRSFEAVIWAWAWLEIGERIGVIEEVKEG